MDVTPEAVPLEKWVHAAEKKLDRDWLTTESHLSLHLSRRLLFVTAQGTSNVAHELPPALWPCSLLENTAQGSYQL